MAVAPVLQFSGRPMEMCLRKKNGNNTPSTDPGDLYFSGNESSRRMQCLRIKRREESNNSGGMVCGVER
jgi:hypothetical protein